jgi:hypothetical protein
MYSPNICYDCVELLIGLPPALPAQLDELKRLWLAWVTDWKDEQRADVMQHVSLMVRAHTL